MNANPIVFSSEQLRQLAQQAIDAVIAAGQIINAYRHVEFQVGHKDIGNSAASQVVTEVDHKAEARILQILQPSCSYYDLALLSEESPDDGQRQQKPAFWCIDPMDGTLAFVNKTPGFSVSIALVDRSGLPLIGVVYDPLTKTLFHAVQHQGAYRNGQAIQLPGLDPERPLTLGSDFSLNSHPWLQQTRTGLQDMANNLGLDGAQIRFQTGAVMNACGVLETANSCYFKYPRSDNSGGSLWDYAATACLFQEAGAVASDIYGQAMDLNRPESTFMNHRGLLYASHPSVAEQIITLHERLAD